MDESPSHHAACSLTTIRDDGSGSAVLRYAGAAAPTQTLGPQALRRALGGRWLYIFGDSSTRGLAISLYQHLGTARIDVAVDDGAWTMNESAWFATSRGSRLLAWLDVIVDAHGRPRHIKTSMKTSAGAFPQGDRSADLAQRWMALRARGCVRLTWRFNTFAAKLKAEAFSELRGTPPPDYHVLQLGSWDDEAHTTLPLYEQQLRTGLQRWATAAVIASRPVSPVLAFSTTVVPMRQMQRDAPCGLDQQRLWYKHKQEIAALTKLRARFLNRVSSGHALHSSLGARCACLSHEQRAEVQANGSQSNRYHAPHLHNLWDGQRLAQLLLHPHDRAPENMAPSRTETRGELRLQDELETGCCCRTNERALRESRVSGGQTSMWMRMCRVSETRSSG